MRMGAHLKAAEIARPRHDDVLDRIARTRITGDGIVRRLPTHGTTFLNVSSSHQARSGIRFSRKPLKCNPPFLRPGRGMGPGPCVCPLGDDAPSPAPAGERGKGPVLLTSGCVSL